MELEDSAFFTFAAVLNLRPSRCCQCHALWCSHARDKRVLLFSVSCGKSEVSADKDILGSSPEQSWPANTAIVMFFHFCLYIILILY